MSLLNLKSIFDDELRERVEIFLDNQVLNVNQSKLDYNNNQFIPQSHGFDVNINPPTLDTLLRGQIYEPVGSLNSTVSQEIFFVNKEETDKLKQPYITETFDSRVQKNDAIKPFINTNLSINSRQYGEQRLASFPTDYSTAVGNNDSAFTPLGQLGKSPLDGMSWESLYESDHAPKDNPSHRGLTPINYPNVNRDNLNIKSQQDGRFGVATTRSSVIGAAGKLLQEAKLTGGFQEFLQDTGKEPYIVSSIGKGGRRINSNITEGGIPLERSLTDSARILKYLTSPAGVAFILKQNFLGENTKSIFLSKDGGLFSSSQRFKDTYNPLSTLLQTFGRAGRGPVGLVDKTEPGLSSLFETDAYPNPTPIVGNVPYDVNKTFNDGSPDGSFGFSDFGNQLLNTIKGAAGVPVPIKEKSSGGDKMTLAKIIKGKELFTSAGSGMTGVKDDPIDISTWDKVDGDIDAEKDGMPFYFKDLRDNSYIFFRAYFDSISENISPTWTPTQYIGRSEPVYTYSMGEREINLTFRLVSQTQDEYKMIYEKMDKLTSMCYPEYYDSGEAGYGNRMKPPFVKLRIGEYFGKTNNELMGFLKSVNYSVELTTTYETDRDVGRGPRNFLVTIGYQVVHSSAPSLDTKFYGVNYG